MRAILLLACVPIVFGCATVRPADPRSLPAADLRPSYERQGFELLFSGGDNGCPAAFHKGGLLYLVAASASPQRAPSVTIYDPAAGLFVTPYMLEAAWSSPFCTAVDFSRIRLPGNATVQLHALTSASFKGIFDRFRDDPNALHAAINAGPPYFRFDSKWKGEKTAVNLPLRINVATLEQAAEQLRTIDRARAKQVIAERLAGIQAIEARNRDVERTAPYVPPAPAPANPERDRDGRRIVRGPVPGGYYDNVRIVSSTVGVIAGRGGATITNSVIEAPVCVRAEGFGLTMRNNTLLCNLCVEFTGSVLVQNVLAQNQCSGRGTNRPDVFGW